MEFLVAAPFTRSLFSLLECTTQLILSPTIGQGHGFILGLQIIPVLVSSLYRADTVS